MGKKKNSRKTKKNPYVDGKNQDPLSSSFSFSPSFSLFFLFLSPPKRLLSQKNLTLTLLFSDFYLYKNSNYKKPNKRNKIRAQPKILISARCTVVPNIGTTVPILLSTFFLHFFFNSTLFVWTLLCSSLSLLVDFFTLLRNPFIYSPNQSFFAYKSI